MMSKISICFLFLLFSVKLFSQGSGNVLTYNGSTQYVDLGSDVSANCRTIEFWFRPNTTINSAIPDVVSLLMRDYLNGSGLNTNEFGFYFTPGSWSSTNAGKLTWYRRVGGTLYVIFSNANSWQANVWYHVAGVIDPVSGMKLYINGVLQASTDPSTQPVQVQTGAPTDMIAIATWGYWGATTGNRFFNGDMDELRFWTTTRSQTEIRENMCMIINPVQTGLQGYYRFDNSSGTTLTDLTGNGYNGTLTNLSSSAWHYSSAPLGDTSAYIYPSSWSAQTLALQYSSGDDFSISNVTGPSAGAHIYRVNSLPNMTTGLASPLTDYYGVFLTGTSGNFDLNYDYSAFSSFCSASCLSFASRNDNAVTSWTTISPAYNNCSLSKTIESSVGVSYRGEYILTLLNNIPPNILGNDTTLCSSSSLNLNAAVPGASYLWNTNAITPGITVSSPGIYWVDVTVNGCTLRDSINIGISSPQPISLGNDTSICQGQTLVLSSGITGATAYQWNYLQATTPTLNVNSTGMYILDLNMSGCHSFDTINVLVIPSPVFALGNDTTICNSSAGYTLNTVGGASSYQWSTGDQTSSIVVTASGSYSVTVSDNGCSSSDSVNVSFATLTPPVLGNDTTLCPGDVLILSVTDPSPSYAWSDGGSDLTMNIDTTGQYWVSAQSGNCIISDTINITYLNQVSLGQDIILCNITNGIILDPRAPGAQYNWSTGDTTETIFVNQPGSYWVQISNASCTVSDSIEIMGDLGGGMVYLPNSFTPNHDSKNDVFNAVSSSLTSLHMQVFNRWGQLIFETQDIYQGWDGKYKGAIVPGDVYVVRIIYTTSCAGDQEFEKIQHVNVIR
jgi:gliding motility-associated-like protein